jgi:imidazolonepropionase-like amidohydrolase
MKALQLIIVCLLALQLKAQVPSPGFSSNDRILIRYATAHIGNGEIIENAYIEIQNGEISRVSDANNSRINESDYQLIIDANGQHVYPGFTIMDSRLGLVEIGAVNATHDYHETGSINPNVHTLPAFNSESKIIPTVRTNGVLMAQIAPVGGVISGTSSLVHFDGWTWQDACIKGLEGVYLNWPKRYRVTGWWAEPGGVKTNKHYQDEVDEVAAFMRASQAYAQLETPEEINLRHESMRAVCSGKERLYIRVDWARDILDVVQFVRAHNIKKVAIVGGAEAHLVMTELKENNIAVVLDRVHSLPVHDDSPVDEPFKLAKTLIDGGIDVAFACNGGMEAMISRNLPFQVGTAVHYGLDYEQAIKCMTLTPAMLMGVETRYGSLEPGKSATLFISEGDALDIRTNAITAALIDGVMIDLSNHQIELYEKFARKLGVQTP